MLLMKKRQEEYLDLYMNEKSNNHFYSFQNNIKLNIFVNY